jgi:hypothetical protein
MKVKWHLEEAVMLVELYGRVEKLNAIILKQEIEKLSLILNKRAEILQIPTDDRFRNVNGIYMQLENIRYIQTNGREGLSAYSKVAQEAYQLNYEMPEVFNRIVQEFIEKYMNKK